MAQVKLIDIFKRYGKVEVVKGLNLNLDEGEFISLLGPSGCGKTTTLRMVAGLERPTSGEIVIGEKIVFKGNIFIPPEKRNLGMVFQSYAVWPHLNVFDNVAYPLKIQKVKKSQLVKKVIHALEQVKLAEYQDRFSHQLSGGQQQRVALARALVMDPDVLLLDEPLSNLDAKLRESMRIEIKQLSKRLGFSVLYVTHDQSEAMVMSDRVAVMNGGVIEQLGTPKEIYLSPATTFVADFIGAINLVHAEIKNNELYIGKHRINNSLLETQNWTNQKVTFAIRPELISFKKQGQLIAQVKDVFYFGNHQEYLVDFEGQSLKITTSLEQNFLPNQQVGIDFGKGQLFVI